MNYPPTVLGLPPYDAPDTVWGMDEQYRRAYVSVKHAVALDLQPQRICEIGVYSGIAAMCFLDACPEAEYVGIDNLSGQRESGLAIVEITRAALEDLGYAATIHIADSQALTALPDPPYDLVHVDADHTRAGTTHDVALAWQAIESGGHILIDNAHDMRVCAGTFDALNALTNHLVDWLYLNEGVGSILVRKP